jgi:GR25 family glycosyltransferase involved in LPS biosynthesis
VIKSFIIRLDENEHSCRIAEECFLQATKFGLHPKYFKAIHGKDAEFHYNETGIKKLGKFKKNKPGVIGCFFSHYYLWKKCIETNEPILILEHDGYLIRSIDGEILNQFNDVLKLDRLDPYSKNYDQELEKEKELPLTVERYNNNFTKVAKYGLQDYFKGAYSYIIKPAAAIKLIKFIAINGHRPADQQLNASIIDLKTTVPTVARLHPFYAIGNNIDSASLTRNLDI